MAAADAEEAEEEEDDDARRSSKNPFPEELHAAELNLKASHGVGFEAAIAGMAYAQVLLASAKYDEALAFATQARNIFQEWEGLEAQAMGEAGAVRLMVNSLLAQEKHDDALMTARHHLDDFSNSGREKAAAVVQLALAEVHQAMNRLGEAHKVVRAALGSFKKHQDDIWVAKSLQTSASISLQKGVPYYLRTALEEAEEALNYFRILGDTKEEATTLLSISKVHLARQEYRDAHTQADKSAALCRDAGLKRWQSAALRKVTSALIALHEESEDALEASMEALELSEEIGDPLGEIKAKKKLASIYVTSGVPEMAAQVLGAALEAAREIQERRQIRSILEQLVQTHMRNGQADKAVSALREEVKLAVASGDGRRQLAAHQSMATLQFGIGDQDDAMKTAREAVRLASESDEKKVRAWAMQLVAEVQAGTGCFKEALAQAGQARDVMQETGDVKEVASAWGLIYTIQVQMDDESGALATKHAQRALYREAGWKYEEAQEMRNIVELHRAMADGVRVPREAVKMARDVVTFYHEIDDKAGEAAATLELAKFQVDARGFTDALQSMHTAKRLSQSLRDVHGVVKAMESESRLYFSNGRRDDAIGTMLEARDLCRKEGEKRQEVDVLKLLVDMRFREIERGNCGASEKLVMDTKQSIKELIELQHECGDLEGQADAMLTLANIQAGNTEASVAHTAQEALQLALRLNNPGKVGKSLLFLGVARESRGNFKDAMEAAREAANHLLAAGEEGDYDLAMQLARRAKQALGLAADGQGFERVQPQCSSDGLRGRNPPTSGSGHPQPALTFQNREHFPYNSRQMFDDSRPTPDKDLWWRQLRSGEEAPGMDDGPGKDLRGVLRSVRPDWTLKDLQSVEKKFGKIKVSTTDDLFRILRSQGASGVNKLLKDAGRKVLKIETLQALHAKATEAA